MTDPEHVVLLIHGIRTRARWAPMIKNALENASSNRLTVEPVYYGDFPLWRFLLPGPTRTAPVARVSRFLRDAREQGNNLAKAPTQRRRISVVAHSFGTYCLFKSLDRNPNIRLHRVILCGSVLPEGFNFGRYADQLGPDKVLNECGDEDPWPILAKKLSFGYGASGTFPLYSERAINRFHRNGHSDYFDAEFACDKWLPFLERGQVSSTLWDTTRHKQDYHRPWWMRVAAALPVRSLILAGLASAVLALLPPGWPPLSSKPAPPFPTLVGGTDAYDGLGYFYLPTCYRVTFVSGGIENFCLGKDETRKMPVHKGDTACIVNTPIAEQRCPQGRLPIQLIQIEESVDRGDKASMAPDAPQPPQPNPTPPPAPSMNRIGVGVFHQSLFKQRPLELHGLQIRTENMGTSQGQLFVDTAEVIPNCTPEGANGHVRARLYGETDFDDGSHDALLLRDFRRNPTNYMSPNHAGPVIGARVPTRIVPVLEGVCGPEMHESLYPGETAE